MKTALWRALRGDTAQSSLRESSSSLSSSSSSSASWTDKDDDGSDDEDANSILPHDAHPRARRMFEAIQRLDLDGAIHVIEEDELDVCAQNGVAPPRGMRKVEQRSELINFEDAYGMTPLLLACRIGAGRVVMGLLLRGADANKENKLGVTPLIACAKYGNVNAANALLRKGVGYDVAQVLRENKRGETAFDHILASAKSKLEPVFDAAAALEEDGNKALFRLQRIGKDQSLRKRQVALLVSKLVGGIRNAHDTGTVPSKQVLSRDAAARVIQRRVRKILAKRRLREAMWRVAALKKRERMIEACAVKIQRSFRQRLARRAAHEQIKLHRAAVQIQKIFRGRVERRARALVLAAQREGQDIAAMWQRHRGWMARFYLCAADVAWEHKVERAVGVIARTVRAWLAKRRVAGLRRRRDAAIVLQRYGRGHLERTPRRQRERRFRKRSRGAREEIRAALASVKDMLPILQSKRQFIAARSICRALKPAAVEAVARRTLCRKVAAAVRLQAFVRGVLGRRRAYMLFARHEARLEALRGCLVVSGLHPVAGAKRQKGLCGKCLKCECERYGEADLGSGMSRDICTHCRHHESNHERLNHGGPHGAVENRRELQDIFQFQVGPAGRHDGSIFKQRKLKREAERELRKAVRARVERQWTRASAQRRETSVHAAQHMLELQQKSNLRDEDARKYIERKLDCSRLGVSQPLLPGLAKVQKMQRSLRDQLEEQRFRLAQIEHLARHSPPPRPLQSSRARDKVLFDIHGMEHRRNVKAKRLNSIQRGCEVTKKGLPPLARKTKSSKRSVNSMRPAAVASIQRGVVSDPFAAECAVASSKKKEDAVASKPSDAVECACQTDGGVEVQVFTAIARLEARIVRRQLSEVMHAKASDARAQEEVAAGAQHAKLNRKGARTQCELASISGRVFPLRGTPIIVGRSLPSDILVGAAADDETAKSRPRLVSKRHLILHLDSLGAELVDLSTNGTYINGHRVGRSEPRRLAHGDVLALGARDGPRFTFYVKNRSISATDGVKLVR